MPSTCGDDELLDLHVDTDAEEEHRNEEVADGRRARGRSGRGPSSVDSESPATNAPTIGASWAASASSAKASVKASAIATSVPAERAFAWSHRNIVGAARDPSAVLMTRNAIATPDDPHDIEERHRPLGDDPDDDGQDDEPEHVVGDGSAEHGSGFDAGERTEIAEHPGGDPDARRRQRGTEEQRRVRTSRRRLSSPRSPAAMGTTTPTTATDTDARADGPKVVEVHLHAHRRSRRITPSSPSTCSVSSALTRFSTDGPMIDTGEDFEHHGWEAESLGDLGRELRRDQDDQGCRGERR